MTKFGIIERTKALLEEISPFDDGLQVLSAEVQPIQSYIERCIQPAVDYILIFCPLHLTTAKALPTTAKTEKTDNGKKIGYIPFPTDFLRIHTIKMAGWEREVHYAISTESPIYAQQQNPYTRGGNSKPIVAKGEKLELYTYKTDDTVEKATYVARPDIENMNGVNEKLFNPICYATAAEVLSIFGDKRSEYMQAKAQQLMQGEL